ncbi:MAG: Superoxide dismutase [Verrucomicrobia bacterium]|nr:Superoxide dismutase [Verrucomicrobiota bacterium]
MKDMTAGTNGLSRREALKTMGAGAALMGLGMISTKAIAAAAPVPTFAASPSTLAQPFTLPKLDYGFDALEPHIDARTMEIHYTKHHQAYITNANKALADFPDLQKMSAEEILKNLANMPEKIRTALRNNVGGHANHSLFWKVIGPNGGGAPTGELANAINKSFGSIDTFKSQFSDAATKRFGSGWAWLNAKSGTLAVESSANQDSPLSTGSTPLLGLDVWEHAYYLHYQNRRADYIAAFWNVINWRQVEANFAAAA